MNPKLSIIIPVYNGEKYISRCLNSVFSLPLKSEELEVIVVDDCSLDNTRVILSEYQSEKPNLIVLCQERNQRQGAARNRGMEIAKGEYIAFVDADDLIVNDGFVNALNAVAISYADVCYFELEFRNQHSTNWTLCNMPEKTHNTIMSGKEYLDNFYSCAYNGAVRNLYKTAFLRNIGIRFVEGVRWEDCDWTVKVYSKAKDIQFVDGVGYRYEQNDTNTCSQSVTPIGYAEQIYAGARLLAFAEEIKLELPGLEKTLRDEVDARYIHNILRVRNITKFSPIFWLKVFAHLPAEAKLLLHTSKMAKWDKKAIEMPILLIVFSFVAYPLATVSRRFVKLVRGKKL